MLGEDKPRGFGNIESGAGMFGDNVGHLRIGSGASVRERNQIKHTTTNRKTTPGILTDLFYQQTTNAQRSAAVARVAEVVAAAWDPGSVGWTVASAGPR